MANKKNMQQDTMATIDTAKALVDKIMSIMEIFSYSPSLSLTFSTNPIGYLLQLLEHAGVTYEQLRLWLTNFLIYTLPGLEIATKAVLLTNLKNMISCSVDPRIPEKYRKQHKSIHDTNTSQEYGIDINIESIDMLDKLAVSPLSDEGKEWYFGLEGVSDVYKFARADDFDAFLWFVIHKGRYPMPAKINDIGDLTNHATGGQADRVEPSDGSLLEPLELFYSSGNPSTTLAGNTFAYAGNSHIMSMCIDRIYDDADNIVHNTLVPVSDDWNSTNWYIRRADQLGKNLGFGWSSVEAKKDEKGRVTGSTQSASKDSRDFSKERAICNLQYIDQASSDSPIVGMVNNKLRFTILPRPVVHVPNIGENEPPWRFRKLLFDAKGNYDPNGKYTLANADGVEPTSLSYPGGVTIDPKTGEIEVADRSALIKNLKECYPGLTVYEFNYDYVMGMKLFDAKVLATTLLDSLINTRVGLSTTLSHQHQDATETVKEIVRNIINVDDSEVSDCFYTFDNSKYERMLRRAEEKRARRQPFGNTTTQIGSFSSVREILEEYDANAELHEQVNVLNRAITQAAVTISEGSDEKDRYAIHFAFVTDLIENLTMGIVTGLLSPKVLMLLEVNQTIMGGTWEKFSMRDLIKAMESIIIALVKEIRDLILQQLLQLLMTALQPLIDMLTTMVISEQVESYVSALRSLIEDCPFIWWKFGNKDLETKLDTVDYADIDVSTTTQNEQPKNKC